MMLLINSTAFLFILEMHYNMNDMCKFRNKTEESVLGLIMGTELFHRLREADSVQFVFKLDPPQTYYIYYRMNNEPEIHFSGAFISAYFINQDDVNELGWKIDGIVEHEVDPEDLQRADDGIDKHNVSRRKKKKEKKK